MVVRRGWIRLSVPGLLHGGTGGLASGRGTTAGTTAAADDAAEDEEEEETADAGADADDEGFVVVDPGTDFFEGGGVFALALFGGVFGVSIVFFAI